MWVGWGKWYLAQDSRLERTVALKILPAEVAVDQQRLRRFMREARAASALKHPNVATIYDIGDHGIHHFIAMEYVEGQTLATRIGGHSLDAGIIRKAGRCVRPFKPVNSWCLSHRRQSALICVSA